MTIVLTEISHDLDKIVRVTKTGFEMPSFRRCVITNDIT